VIAELGPDACSLLRGTADARERLAQAIATEGI
jgi:hypothetical protein